MKKKSKIIAGGIILTSAIGATSFAIIDPYNIIRNKKEDVTEKSLKITENMEKVKESNEDKRDTDDITLDGVKDGTYLGVSKGYGGDIKVNVTIENGKIKNIEVLSHSETPRYYEKGSKVIASILKENSANVDSISGATLTSDGIKNAVKDALSKAGFNIEKNSKEKGKSNKSKTVNLKANNSKNTKSIDLKEYTLKDGSYIGEAIGFKGNVRVKVIIGGGKLSDIKIISHNDDAEFFNKAKGVIVKILKNQGTAGVDTVSGATYSSRGILNAVKDALRKASNGNNSLDINSPDETEQNIPRQNRREIEQIKKYFKGLKDGVYFGKSNGYYTNSIEV